MKKSLVVPLKILWAMFWVSIFVLLIATCVLVVLSGDGSIHETDALSDYGKILGNYDNEAPAEFVFSFFPEKLEESFSDVTYHYKAKKGDTYAYECYLEFVIRNRQTYDEFVSRHMDRTMAATFAYAPGYLEQSVSNIYTLEESYERPGIYHIQYAEIGKILCCEEEQRVVFFAMGVYDGGGAYAHELDRFFDRFGITPLTYRLDAYNDGWDQQAGITYRQRLETGTASEHLPVIERKE